MYHPTLRIYLLLVMAILYQLQLNQKNLKLLVLGNVTEVLSYEYDAIAIQVSVR
jgi:hypothetical protein